MKSKFPKGLMLVQQTNGSILYRCQCDCGDPDCDVYIDFDYDYALKILSLTFFKNVYFTSPYLPFYSGKWFDDFKDYLKGKHYKKAIHCFYKDFIVVSVRNFCYRFKKCIRLLFTGYLEMETDFILTDKEHISNFISALEEGQKVCLETEENK